MKNLNNKTKVIALLAIILITAGIVVTATVGLNYDLRYKETKRIQLYIGKDFEINDIKQITDETLSNQNVIVQKVEVFEDTVNIISNDITEEQKANTINKINEKYQTELVVENIEITSIPNTRGKDIIKPYIIPFIIATILILGYMGIKYKKLGIVKIISKTFLTLVLTQALLLSVIAITRIPVGKLTIPMVLSVYVLSLFVITSKFENNLNKE